MKSVTETDNEMKRQNVGTVTKKNCIICIVARNIIPLIAVIFILGLKIMFLQIKSEQNLCRDNTSFELSQNTQKTLLWQ